MPAIIRVHSPYLGRSFFVATADMDDPRKVQLPIYTRSGIRWSDTKQGARAIRAHRDSGMLHRDNINAPEMTDADVEAILACAP